MDTGIEVAHGQEGVVAPAKHAQRQRWKQTKRQDVEGICAADNNRTVACNGNQGIECSDIPGKQVSQPRVHRLQQKELILDSHVPLSSLTLSFFPPSTRLSPEPMAMVSTSRLSAQTAGWERCEVADGVHTDLRLGRNRSGAGLAFD